MFWTTSAQMWFASSDGAYFGHESYCQMHMVKYSTKWALSSQWGRENPLPSFLTIIIIWETWNLLREIKLSSRKNQFFVGQLNVSDNTKAHNDRSSGSPENVLEVNYS